MSHVIAERAAQPSPWTRVGRGFSVTVLVLAGAMAGENQRPATAGATTCRVDFTPAAVAAPAGWTAVGADGYDDARGYGWVGGPAVRLDAQTRPDDLRRTFAAGGDRATFRVRARPGRYRLAVTVGDMRQGHAFDVTTNVPGLTLPRVVTRASQFVNVNATVDTAGPTLDLTVDPRDANGWVLNALAVVPVEAMQEPVVVRDFADPDAVAPRSWQGAVASPDPTAELLKRFDRNRPATRPATRPAAVVDRADYLRFIESDVDFWLRRLDANGAVIDPYRKREVQYATPCFAFAAAQLAAGLGRGDLVEPAAKALDWATLKLSRHDAADHHEDFFPPPVAHAMELLKPNVSAERYGRWVAALRSYDPYGGYEMAMGSMNWNVVALAGESMFHDLGVRADLDYVEDSLDAQGHLWADDWGVYLEGPIPYDAWPRLFLMDMVAHGYRGRHRAAIDETLRRGAATGLLMQSPTGEMPTGARSSQHVWNEALECALFEGAAAAAGDPALAASYKRAAALALDAMRRWKRATGEFQIVKNWVDPADGFGYEIYSTLSQYNLMACSTLCVAYQRAAATAAVAPGVAPAEVGGFVLDLRGPFHKVIANAGGTYVEVDTAGDGHYSPTGLLRVHRAGVDPVVGPSDGLVGEASPQYPAGAAKTTAAVGVAWRTADGTWRRLAECLGASVKTELTVGEQMPNRVEFAVRYTCDLGGPTAVVEQYVVTPGRVEQTSGVEGFAGPVRVVVPILANDGRAATNVEVGGGITVRLGTSGERFAVDSAAAVRVEPQLYAFRNGWAQLGVFDLPPGRTSATLVMTPTGP